MEYNKELLAIRIGQLIAKEIKETISPDEKAELAQLINSSDENRKIYNDLLEAQGRAVIAERLTKFDGNAAFERFEQQIAPNQAQRRRIKYSISVAASLILFTSVAAYFIIQKKAVQTVQVIKDIGPGGNKAILTLASGKKIILDDHKTGTLFQGAGISIHKTSGGKLVYIADPAAAGQPQTNTITTPKGGQYQVELPDHSKVWLNAASSITYLTALNNQGERRVELSGEAYFEVAKDKFHPFIVKTSGQEITVLGTHFNVNSYADEKAVRTTLLEGSVRVHPLKLSIQDVIIKPGEQAELLDGHLKVSTADIESAIAWKEGLFNYSKTDVPTIMRQISRWYNVDVEYSGNIPADKFTGGISRESKISTVLKMFELINLKYKLVEENGRTKLIINP